MKTSVVKAGDIFPAEYATLRISSPVFDNNGSMPLQYTCDGANISPAIDIDGIPALANSLAIIMEDADTPGKTWVHWVAWNIPVQSHIREKCVLEHEGLNDFRERKYNGPCPPYGTHRYHFKVYALDALLNLAPNTRKVNLELAMAGHIVGYGELVGKYKRR